MRSQIEQLVGELKRRKARGETHVAVDAQTLEGLRACVRARVVKDKVASAPLAQAARGAVGQGARPPLSGAGAGDASASAQGLSAFVAAGSAHAAAKPAAPAAARLSAEDQTVPETAPAFDLPAGDKQTRWQWLKDRVLSCPVCIEHLHPGRKVVFGVGSLDADIFFCGEAPGMDESVQGEPFVGPAGQLLTKMIQAMGLSREGVYIGNIMNWRPRQNTEIGNREPSPREMQFCLPYLKAQIAIVRPKVIVALGRTAVNALLAPEKPLAMGKVRGQWQSFEGIALMPTYHPSYLLRSQLLAERRKVWEDLMAVMGRVGMPISEKQQAYFLKK